MIRPPVFLTRFQEEYQHRCGPNQPPARRDGYLAASLVTLRFRQACKKGGDNLNLNSPIRAMRDLVENFPSLEVDERTGRIQEAIDRIRDSSFGAIRLTPSDFQALIDLKDRGAVEQSVGDFMTLIMSEGARDLAGWEGDLQEVEDAIKDFVRTQQAKEGQSTSSEHKV